MEVLYRYFSGVAISLMALFAPIAPLVWCVVAFILIDFISGVAASRAEALRSGEVWFFQSQYAWKTLYKLGFTIVAVAMAWLIDECILSFLNVQIARLFTGFVCGVELWSFLENASMISDAPLFEWMRKYVKRRINKEID